jgi:hypothetical protein
MRRLGILAAVLLLASACIKEAPEQVGGAIPASLRTYPKPFAEVWKIVLDTVQYDFLTPIEIADKKRGYFTSELIKDYQPFQKTKYRLSGTVMFDGAGTIVKLYKQLQVEDGNTWVTVPSDLTLERKILDTVSKKLTRN